jgi:hypothetical protein
MDREQSIVVLLMLGIKFLEAFPVSHLPIKINKC